MEFECEAITSDLKYEIDVVVADIKKTSDSIISFDVSDKNAFAVGFSNEYIGIYDEGGEFINGFSVETYGGHYYLSWQEDTLWVYILRNRLAVHVIDVTSERVSIQEVYKIKSNSTNNVIWRGFHSKSTVEKDGITYEMIQSLPFRTNADTIVKHLPDGTSMECFSVRKENVASAMSVGLIVTTWLLLFGVVWFICSGFKKRK